MTRIILASYITSPVLLMVSLAWMYLAVGIALVFTVGACLFAGYVIGRLDDPPKHSFRWSIGA